MLEVSSALTRAFGCDLRPWKAHPRAPSLHCALGTRRRPRATGRDGAGYSPILEFRLGLARRRNVDRKFRREFDCCQKRRHGQGIGEDEFIIGVFLHLVLTSLLVLMGYGGAKVLRR